MLSAVLSAGRRKATAVVEGRSRSTWSRGNGTGRCLRVRYIQEFHNFRGIASRDVFRLRPSTPWFVCTALSFVAPIVSAPLRSGHAHRCVTIALRTALSMTFYNLTLVAQAEEHHQLTSNAE
jgi:hypothetical protein